MSDDNARLIRHVEALNVENSSLKKENAALRKRLSRYEDARPPKNSGNSSVPPSKERMGDEIKRRTSSLREKSGKTPGGQPGHEGKTRMMTDCPDETEDIQPNYCRECGRDLSGMEGVEEYREECVGFRIAPVIRRLRFLNKTRTCGCCDHVEHTRHKNPVYLSSEIRALAVYLNVVMCMPYNRIRSFMHDVMRIDISEGSIRNFIEESGGKEMDEKQTWSSRLQELLRKAVHWRNTNPGTAADTSKWTESLDKLLNENLDKFKKPFRQLRNSLRKLKDHVFHFLTDPRGPSHNNASEAGIRILKVKQKRSGGFRSQSGAEDFMSIHSVADTAKKNDFSRWDAVLALV